MKNEKYAPRWRRKKVPGSSRPRIVAATAATRRARRIEMAAATSCQDEEGTPADAHHCSAQGRTHLSLDYFMLHVQLNLKFN